MTIEWRFLNSKVARRIFLLFVTCALIPLVGVSVLLFVFVSSNLHEQSERRLHGAAKLVAMEIYDRLRGLEVELASFAVARDGRAGTPTIDEGFSAVALLTADGQLQPLLGHIEPAPSRTAGRDGVFYEGVRLVVPEESHRTLLLERLIDPSDPGGAALLGQIRPGLLWGVDGSDVLPTARAVVVLDHNDNLLFATPGDGEALAGRIAQGVVPPAPGAFDWEHGREEYVAYGRSLFLQARYGTPEWKVMVTEPKSLALLPLRRLTRYLPPVVLLCLSVVALLSVVEIRKSLVPLEALRRGTEEIARNNLDWRIEVKSGDEFEGLAESFNSMARKLDRQFKTLTTMAEMDRAILSTLDRKDIAGTILERVPQLFECDAVVVTLFDLEDGAEATNHLRFHERRVRQLTETIELGPEQRRAFAGCDGHLLFSEGSGPAYLASLTRRGFQWFLALPVLVKQQLAGVITLGRREAQSDADPIDIADARGFADRVAVALSNVQLVEEQEQLNWQTLNALARAIDAKSSWTAGHSTRLTHMALQIASVMGLSDTELKVLHRGGLLHDIGKIGTPHRILEKPGRLTDEEMAEMREHVRIGARILEPIEAYRAEIPVVLSHHEKWDGTGYPDGLAGEAIDLKARILAVADVFDALISDRPYRAGWELERVVDRIRKGAGTDFDPEVVAAFLQVIQPRLDAAGLSVEVETA